MLWITIISQETEYKPRKERISEINNNMKKERTKAGNSNLSKIRENMSKDKKKQMIFFNNYVIIIG